MTPAPGVPVAYPVAHTRVATTCLQPGLFSCLFDADCWRSLGVNR